MTRFKRSAGHYVYKDSCGRAWATIKNYSDYWEYRYESKYARLNGSRHTMGKCETMVFALFDDCHTWKQLAS